MEYTDKLRDISKHTGIGIAALMSIADDLQLRTTYDRNRHRWVIAEDARTIRTFIDHIENHIAAQDED